jgi:hypothetical protein
MSSLQGTNTEFSSIAGNFLYLTLTPEDKEYLTSIDQKTFKFYGVDEPDKISNPKKLEILSQYLDVKSMYTSLEKYKREDTRSSILQLLQNINLNKYLSGVINMIQQTQYNSILTAQRKGNVNGITFFAFIDGSENLINNWVFNWKPDNWNSDKSLLYKRELLKHHTLPFKLLPGQIYNKRLELATMLSDYISVYNKIVIESIDGQLYLNYSKSDYLLDGEGYYPSSIQRSKILQAIACDDGIVYVIEKPIFPIVF